jgi:hypothetical protein
MIPQSLYKFYSIHSKIEDIYRFTKKLWFFEKIDLINEYNQLWFSYKYLFNFKVTSLDDICIILCNVNQIFEKDLSVKIDKYIIKAAFKQITEICDEVKILIDDKNKKVKYLFNPTITDRNTKYKIDSYSFYKNTWDQIKKWDIILKINYIQDDDFHNIPFYAGIDWILESFLSDINSFIKKNTLLFTIHSYPSDLTLYKLKSKKWVFSRNYLHQKRC